MSINYKKHKSMNKKILFIFSLLIIGILNINSQNFKGGLSIGLVASQVDGDKLSGYYHPGVKIGVFTEYSLNKKVSLKFELYYILKGSQKNSSETSPTKFIQHLNYIEVPIFAQLHLTEKFELFGGLSFGYLFKFAEKDESGLIPESGRTPYNKYEYALHGGFLYQVVEKWKVGLNTSYSILPIRDLPKYSNMAYHNRRQYNNNLTISAYYTL